MKSRANFVERVGVLKDLGVITCCLALTFLVIEIMILFLRKVLSFVSIFRWEFSHEMHRTVNQATEVSKCSNTRPQIRTCYQPQIVFRWRSNASRGRLFVKISPLLSAVSSEK